MCSKNTSPTKAVQMSTLAPERAVAQARTRGQIRQRRRVLLAPQLRTRRAGDMPVPSSVALRKGHLAVLSDHGSPVSTPLSFNVASTCAHERLLRGAVLAACSVSVLLTSSNTSPTWFRALFISLLSFLSGECVRVRRYRSTTLEPSPPLSHASPGLSSLKSWSITA